MIIVELIKYFTKGNVEIAFLICLLINKQMNAWIKAIVILQELTQKDTTFNLTNVGIVMKIILVEAKSV